MQNFGEEAKDGSDKENCEKDIFRCARSSFKGDVVVEGH